MANETRNPEIVLGKTFLDALFALPKTVQRKLMNFITKFQRNPKSSGINLERVDGSKDGKMYSARIDQKYRVIIAYDGSAYLLLYADNHDDAYAWAVSRRLEINPRNNAIQLFVNLSDEERDEALRAPVESEVSTAPSQTTQPQAGSSLAKPTSSGASKIAHDGFVSDAYRSLTEDEMRELGVPDNYAPIMMRQRTWTHLNDWLGRIPEDAKVYLQLVAEGQPKLEVLAMAKESAQLASSQLGLEKTISSESIGAMTSAAESASDAESIVDETRATTFQEALSSYSTQQSFVVVQGEEDLQRLLDAPLEQWRVFLHASQRGYVEGNYHGPFRLTGGAGTGKTVVAMHRAKRLAAQLVKNNSMQKVLFTTYSANLATDIQSNLKLICTNDELGKIDVINLDKFVFRFLRNKGYGYAIWYEDRSYQCADGQSRTTRDVWREALRNAGSDYLSEFSPEFFEDEWRQVIVPQQVASCADYLHVVRRGRGMRLGRSQKVAIWKVVDRYQQLMKDYHACDIDMAMSMVAHLLRDNDHSAKQYAHVVVDEGQDFSTPAYRVLRSLVDEHDNDMFIVGDAQQRIYGRTVVLSKCGIKITGRAKRLTINYRTTEEIRSAADRIFATGMSGFVDAVFDAVSGAATNETQPMFSDDLDGGVVPSGDSRSLFNGPAPLTHRFATQQDEITFVEQWIADRCGRNQLAEEDGEDTPTEAETSADARNICVVARTGYLVEKWANSLDDALPYGVYKLGPEEEDRQRTGIRVATMHRVKGLEFDYVIIVDVEPGVCPPKPAVEAASDKMAVDELYKQERSLIYVALTRARKEVLLLGRA